MPIIKIETEINAPIQIVFDLARCIDLHTETMSRYKEKAVAGVTKGLINNGESVTWEAMHFGVKQKLTSKITEYKRPHHFRDEMVSGAFSTFKHDHYFRATKSGTIMKDLFDYISPLGILGKIADAIFLEKYMRKILAKRSELIKNVAESNNWQRFLPQQ